MTHRLESLLIRDFRSIAGEWTIPLDANVVLIHGPNGAGKTSVLSALELAATGSIAHLDRAGDKTYTKHLHHKGQRSGQVVLHADLGQLTSGQASVSEGGVTSQPLFSGKMADTFIERCFLPQATLGRLFEVYARSEKGDTKEPPLVRFVKELLGLDSLDALISGLYPTGHVSRVQKLSLPWQKSEDQVAALGRELHTAEASRQRAENRVDELAHKLGSELLPDSVTTVGMIPGLLRAADEALQAAHRTDTELSRLREAVLRLDAVETTLVQSGLQMADPNEPPEALDVRAAEERYENWQNSRALPETRKSGLLHAFEDEGLIRPSALIRHLRVELERAEENLEGVRRRSGELADLRRQGHAFEERLLGISADLELLAGLQDRSAGDNAVSDLASALIAVLEHVDGQTCPVCDQDFRGDTSLHEHVSGKIARLQTHVAELVELEARIKVLTRERVEVTGELREIEHRSMQLRELQSQMPLEEALAETIRQLQLLVPLAEAGLVLEAELSRAQDAHSVALSNRSLLEQCITDLDQVAELLDADPPRGLLPQRIAGLRAQTQGQLDEMISDDRRLAKIGDAREELAAALTQLTTARDAEHGLNNALAAQARHVDEANRRKKEASDLRKAAELLRAATTTRVFDHQLNGAWARIFSRLVPSEPFIPQFKHMAETVRTTRIEIETVDRNGMQAATPAAMLSQGNLNTAALSLFLALHFAVPPKLPWLIFDDPVQSMDDVHISNFAAMVKQMTRRNGRQVIIAVHQRELFEYLALELTPAAADEQQLQVILDRTYGRTVIDVDRLKYTEDRALAPIPAA